ncbi:uncharacterized protein LOC112598215 [Melanaphis sacchari]|uniref:uncharacterized protein LOC112598215 n=1 Tax=Melanaphis sacchari TaxID=742174 RepID=UPI000DC140BD|nr:uncharacterized protein LOC112598215 [Melanaphis sacchari]
MEKNVIKKTVDTTDDDCQATYSPLIGIIRDIFQSIRIFMTGLISWRRRPDKSSFDIIKRCALQTLQAIRNFKIVYYSFPQCVKPLFFLINGKIDTTCWKAKPVYYRHCTEWLQTGTTVGRLMENRPGHYDVHDVHVTERVDQPINR